LILARPYYQTTGQDQKTKATALLIAFPGGQTDRSSGHVRCSHLPGPKSSAFAGHLPEHCQSHEAVQAQAGAVPTAAGFCKTGMGFSGQGDIQGDGNPVMTRYERNEAWD